MLLELRVREKKKEEEQNQNFHFRFSTVRRINGTLGVYFTLESLRVFIYKSFASLSCVYLGAALIS